MHLTIDLAKCEFPTAIGMYLGQRVRQGTVCPVQDKNQTAEQYSTPATKKELMHFLGLVGY